MTDDVFACSKCAGVDDRTDLCNAVEGHRPVVLHAVCESHASSCEWRYAVTVSREFTQDPARMDKFRSALGQVQQPAWSTDISVHVQHINSQISELVAERFVGESINARKHFFSD